MSDTLEIFGQEWTGVTGFKATDDNDTIKTFIRPQGTIIISQNGQGIDVSQYASADVAVPETKFIVTVSWNSTTQMWEPDCTIAEYRAARSAGKTITVQTDDAENATADGETYGPGAMRYIVKELKSASYHGQSRRVVNEYWYIFSADGVELDDVNVFVSPSGTLSITQNGTGIDVAAYASVDVNVSGSSKNIQVNQDGGNVRTNGYTSTNVSITVAKAGTYNVSWTAWRSSSQGTMGTNLYKNGTAGTAQQTWTSTYGQHIVLNNQTYAQGDVLTLYATAGSNSRYCYVGDLVIVEQ